MGTGIDSVLRERYRIVCCRGAGTNDCRKNRNVYGQGIPKVLSNVWTGD